MTFSARSSEYGLSGLEKTDFHAGSKYDITAFDNYGRYDRISVSVQLSRCLRAFFSFL